MILFRVRVRGESMWPHLVSGKTYFASGILKPRIGDYVVFHSSLYEDPIVKRVDALDGDILRVNGSVSWSSSFTPHISDVIGVLIAQRLRLYVSQVLR